jgi:VanZ family protein
MKMMFVRLSAWLLAVAIVVLSVVSPQERPVVAPHIIEHAGVFVALGVAFALAYPRRRWVAAGLTVFCGALEWAQLSAPGRHARVSDLLVDIVASLLGVAAVTLVAQLARRYTTRFGARRDRTSS